MIIFDVASYAMQALAVGLVDPHNANFALDRQHPPRRLAAMRRNLESTVNQFPLCEHGFRTAVESFTT